MTNHWNDLANSDCILIMGSNPAENHPISFKWVLKAQDKGAKVVSVDPRFTHSSSKADFYVQLRVGTDIAFLGGMINYILNNDKYFKQYVIDSTNGPTVVGERFGFSDGLFSGFNAGFGALLGPTGGFILGFLLCTLLYWLLENHLNHVLLLVLGTLVCYAFGTAWFVQVYSSGGSLISIGAALAACVLPFIIPDSAKLALAVVITRRIGKHI